MRCSLLISSLLLTTIAFAQPDQLPHYTNYDSCPDAAKNNIRTRTIYTKFQGASVRTSRDSIVEHYARNGNLVMLYDKQMGDHFIGGRVIRIHYFEYDDHNRIISDSGVNASPHLQEIKSDFLVKTTYDTAGRLIISTHDLFGKQSTYYSYYNEHNEIIAQYEIDLNGDTISVIEIHGDTSIYFTRLRLAMGMINEDSLITITTPSCVTELFGDSRMTTWYDQYGRLVSESSYMDNNVFNDSAHYEYDANGRLFRKYANKRGLLDNDPDFIITLTTYRYDKNGKLISEHTTGTYEETKFSIVYYTYNDKGLLTGMKWTVKAQDSEEMVKEVVVKEEVWEYGYW